MAYPPYPCLGAPVDGACPQTPTYPARECTSGGAWWGSQFQGKPWPEGWGNADNWPSAARAAGFVVNSTCVPNSVMCIPPNRNGAGPKGHIAFVTGSPLNGKVAVIEMNFLIEHGFDYRSASTQHCEFIHLTNAPNPPPPTPQPPEDDVTILAIRSAGSVDPHGPGAVYLVKDAVYGPKRWVTNQPALAVYETLVGPVKTLNAYVLDRMEEGPHIDAVANPQEP